MARLPVFATAERAATATGEGQGGGGREGRTIFLAGIDAGKRRRLDAGHEIPRGSPQRGAARRGMSRVWRVKKKKKNKREKPGGVEDQFPRCRANLKIRRSAELDQTIGSGDFSALALAHRVCRAQTV